MHEVEAWVFCLETASSHQHWKYCSQHTLLSWINQAAPVTSDDIILQLGLTVSDPRLHGAQALAWLLSLSDLEDWLRPTGMALDAGNLAGNIR